MKVYIVFDSEDNYILSVYATRESAYKAIINSYPNADDRKEAKESLELNGGYEDLEVVEREVRK